MTIAMQSHVFDFSVHIEGMFAISYSLLSVQ